MARHTWTQATRLLQAFVVAYSIAILCVRLSSSHDPTSVFFQPELGFKRHYSLLREEEAKAFIEQSSSRMKPPSTTPFDPALCVGALSVQRGNFSYLDTTIGSILEGLSGTEREALFLMPFVAQLHPDLHPFYNETWLTALSDQVLTYDFPGQPGLLPKVTQLEQTVSGRRKKSLFDYTYLLRACYNTTAAPYILILEDDILAARGWYASLQHSLHELESRARSASTIYLRLFYTEKNFGWNKENWRIYLFYSLAIDVSVAGLIFFLRRRPNPSSSYILTGPTTMAILFVCVPACIALAFAAGRLTIAPLPHGVHRMDKYGCCSQALLFPRQRVPALISRIEQEFEKAQPDPVDALIENYANEAPWERWAVTPSLIQHIGARSGKTAGDVSKWNRERAANIWNFEFETFHLGKHASDLDLAGRRRR